MTDATHHERTALVTGASSGIGAELARLFAGDGYDLVLTARREERLATLADELAAEHGVGTTVVTQDLADPDAARALYDEVRERDIAVHTLVNNAGFTRYGQFHETPLEDDEAMIRVMLTALTGLTKLFVRPMVERGEGAVLNTASAAGMAPAPGTAVYGATKAYVLSLSEAIAHELEDEGVTVTALCPGPVETELITKDGMEESGIQDGALASPAAVAEAGYDALQAGKRVEVPSVRMKVLTQLTRVLPRKQITKVAAGQYD